MQDKPQGSLTWEGLTDIRVKLHRNESVSNHEIRLLLDAVGTLWTRIDTLTDALKWYANKENYEDQGSMDAAGDFWEEKAAEIYHDNGELAREALKAAGVTME